MLRAGFAGVAVLALALLPKACVKKPPPDPPIDAPLPPPIPITSATTPPIWSPPTATTPTAAATATPPPSAELVKARAAADAKDFKKVRSLLEKKVRGGKCAPEESQLLFRACVQLKDKACSEGVKAKHPDDLSSE